MTDVADPPLTPAAERLLAAASTLFYAHGIRAVGVDAIAEAAGTTKKTLYDRFGSKDALVALYLERRARHWQRFLEEEIATHAPGGERVLAVFDAARRWQDGQARGCAFVNAYAEVGGTDHPALPVIRAEKEWMRTRLTQLVADAGIPHPESVGATVHLLYEGALVATTAGDDPEALTTARKAAAGLVG
ncbi:TetR/AcrR family transcriptional regulator [Blastococcus xanthinilyticus]|uniref:TetR family transcriptional regulator n=1 Tax=Blastococcus xanthinilyticus TaxID=1564164 RepID=A0A5S5CUN6_9ACTN|nr:TetR/AcrR family transcriptional regulator [Blastococcus xanthinilyticus]TYP87521.1 TetR family transcriptional regulator [Blastococcus xanthinilyticus]